jgi:hypothetical protein
MCWPSIRGEKNEYISSSTCSKITAIESQTIEKKWYKSLFMQWKKCHQIYLLTLLSTGKYTYLND